METGTARPEIVSAQEWEQARARLLTAEKELTRAQDALAAQRRRLPMRELGDDYEFATSEGPKRLVDLFLGRDQLVVYQFMDAGPDHLCPGCSQFTDSVPPNSLVTLADRGISWATISNMPLAQIEEGKVRKGWTMPFHSSRGTTFADDIGAGGGFQFCCFLRDGDRVFMTYSTGQRGVDRLVYLNSILDLTAFGRQEDWEDSPAGWPQHPTYG